MNRFFRIVGVLSLVTCLASAVLAVTVLRPHSKVFTATVGTNGNLGDIPLRSLLQVKHHWTLSPPWRWHFGRVGEAACGPFDQTITDGWQYGPFAFEEERVRISWPATVEGTVRAAVLQKLGVKKPALDIQKNDSKALSWHVVALGPDGKRLEMDLDERGKSVSVSK